MNCLGGENMANLKSAKKRVLTNNAKRERNVRFKSDMRTKIKHVNSFIDANDKESAVEALQQANKSIDKAIQKGAVHRNNGERHKSRLTQKVNQMGA